MASIIMMKIMMRAARREAVKTFKDANDLDREGQHARARSLRTHAESLAREADDLERQIREQQRKKGK
jgi:hypothetical protein